MRQIPFGNYTLLHRLARGGMAELYLARSSGIAGVERLVVIKVVSSQYAEDANFVSMFQDEVRIAATLAHPNIGQVVDVGTVNGQYYLAMEHIYGQDLRAILRRCLQRGHPVPVAIAAQIGAKIASALHCAHEARALDGRSLNIIHRDVSPSNIMVTYDGQVKLVDFGIARAANRVSLTLPGTIKGKMRYLSPEQLLGQEIDRRSDIFTLGITLWEATIGQHLFDGRQEIQIYEAIATGKVRAPSSVKPDYPPELERVLLKALAVSPADRHATAGDLQLDLERFATGVGVSLSNIELQRFMHEEFEPETTAWQRRQASGTSLVDHLLSLAEPAERRGESDDALERTTRRDGEEAAPVAAVLPVVAKTPGPLTPQAIIAQPTQTDGAHPAQPEVGRKTIMFGSPAPTARRPASTPVSEATRPRRPVTGPVQDLRLHPGSPEGREQAQIQQPLKPALSEGVSEVIPCAEMGPRPADAPAGTDRRPTIIVGELERPSRSASPLEPKPGRPPTSDARVLVDEHGPDTDPEARPTILDLGPPAAAVAHQDQSDAETRPRAMPAPEQPAAGRSASTPIIPASVGAKTIASFTQPHEAARRDPMIEPGLSPSATIAPVDPLSLLGIASPEGAGLPLSERSTQLLDREGARAAREPVILKSPTASASEPVVARDVEELQQKKREQQEGGTAKSGRTPTGDWSHQATAEGERRAGTHPYFRDGSPTVTAEERQSVPIKPWAIIVLAVVVIAGVTIGVIVWLRHGRSEETPPPKKEVALVAVQLQSDPGGAAVITPDGWQLGRTPVALQLRAGETRELELRLDGYQSQAVKVTAKAPRYTVVLRRTSPVTRPPDLGAAPDIAPAVPAPIAKPKGAGDVAQKKHATPPKPAPKVKPSPKAAPPSKTSKTKTTLKAAPPSKTSKTKTTLKAPPPTKTSKTKTTVKAAPSSKTKTKTKGKKPQPKSDLVDPFK